MCSIIIFSFSFTKFHTSVLDYSRKKSRGIDNMEFPGLLKKEQVDFLGAIKTNEEFPGLIMKKSCGIPRVLDFRPYNFCVV